MAELFWLSDGRLQSSLAQDGHILITQGKALDGGVTPGDAAGFPVSLSRSGSYRLASNLTSANHDAISVNAPEVGIDLNG